MTNNVKHGDCNKRVYNIWKNMRHRCKTISDKKKAKVYKDKNISVCDEWENSYQAFKQWAMDNGYSDSLSIDRINNDDNYCPENCRWTTQTVQSANTRILYSHNKSGYRGVSWNTKYRKWEVSISIKNRTVKIGFYDLVMDAAKAYDTYVKDNNLNHTLNGVKGRVESSVGATLTCNNTSGYVGVSTSKRLQGTKKPWQVGIRINKVLLFSGYFATPLEAAKAREEYIVDNGLGIKRNF